MKNILNTSSTFFFFFFTAVVIFMGFSQVSNSFTNAANQYNKNIAVDGCLKSSVYRSVRTEGTNVTTTEEAISTSVEKCLSLKGY